MQSLYSGLPVSFETEEVDHVQHFGRQQGHGQVEKPIAKANGGHQTTNRDWRNEAVREKEE